MTAYNFNINLKIQVCSYKLRHKGRGIDLTIVEQIPTRRHNQRDEDTL